VLGTEGCASTKHGGTSTVEEIFFPLRRLSESAESVSGFGVARSDCVVIPCLAPIPEGRCRCGPLRTALATSDRSRYPSDLTDEEWALITADPAGQAGGGKRRAIPKDLPPRSTVYHDFGLVDLGPHARPHSPRALGNLPETGGREPSPTGSIIDMRRGRSRPISARQGLPNYILG